MPKFQQEILSLTGIEWEAICEAVADQSVTHEDEDHREFLAELSRKMGESIFNGSVVVTDSWAVKPEVSENRHESVYRGPGPDGQWVCVCNRKFPSLESFQNHVADPSA